MSDDIKKKLEELASPGTSGSDTRMSNTPENWRPRSEIGSDGGFAISSPRPLGNTPGAEEILVEHGLDPAEWVVTSARHGKWQTFNGDWLESSRINISPATHNPNGRDFDLEQLVDEIKKWKPGKGTKNVGGDGAYLHVGADKQLGKRAGSGGTAQTVERILRGTEGSVLRLEGLRRYGLSLGTIVIPEVGDHVEGNVSQNGRLQGQAASDLGQTEQVRVGRRLLLQQIKTFAPLAERIVVPVVNGNHDEVTRQVVADPADGWNVEIASAVEDACRENFDLAHVEFRYPSAGHQTLAVDINGTMLGLFHGHQFTTDVKKYLSGQMLGQTALGGCDVWISGHYHHFKSLDVGHRFWVQAPTVDPGSDWFRDRAGDQSRPGVLTLVIGGSYDPREFIGVIPAL
jgi:predicted phosphodiesterase